MTGLLLLSLFVAVCSSAAVPSDIPIDASATCGTTHTVEKEGEFSLMGSGDSPEADCSFEFTADAVTDADCQPALCFLFDIYAFFKDPKASLTIQSGQQIMTYNNESKTPRGPVCTQHERITVTMREEAGYTYNPKEPKDAYKFRLSIYHKCGAKGSVKNTKFADAIMHADGYHRAEERESRERNQFVTGILLGFGLASMFLVVLLIAYCYVRNSPNRPPGRSVGMPKVGGFKKKMKPNAPSGHTEVEMGVGYKAHDPDAKPEAEALLTSGASQQEKPLAITADEIDEKKTEPEQVDKDLEKMKEVNETEENKATDAEGDNSGNNETNTGADNSGSGDADTGADNTGKTD